jgi:Sulfotransferase family
VTKASPQHTLPDFVVIGGSKSGTHWINECLREHPEVYVPPDTHEIFFFDLYFDRGVRWYAHYFRGHRDEKRIGDVTPTYLASPLAPARLHSVLPEATLLVSLRNPVRRAWSKYLHLWRKGDIPPQVDFWSACRLRPEILGDGEYFRCLAPWRRLFPAGRLHLLVLDDAAADPYGYMRRIYEILGVDPTFQASMTARKTNEHQTPRSMLAAKVAFRASRFLHDHRLHWVVEQGKRLQIDRLVLEPGRDAAKDPAPLGAADRERLADHFRDDVAALSELVGRDLVKLWLGGTRREGLGEAAPEGPPENVVRRAAG